MFKKASYVSIDAMIFDESISPERVNKISEEIADVLAKNGLAVADENDLVNSIIGVQEVLCHPNQMKFFKKLLKKKAMIILPKDSPSE